MATQMLAFSFGASNFDSCWSRRREPSKGFREDMGLARLVGLPRVTPTVTLKSIEIGDALAATTPDDFKGQQVTLR